MENYKVEVDSNDLIKIENCVFETNSIPSPSVTVFSLDGFPLWHPPTQFEMVTEFHTAFDLPVRSLEEWPELPVISKDSQNYEFGEFKGTVDLYQVIDKLYIAIKGLSLAMDQFQTSDIRFTRIRLLIEEVAEYIIAEYEDDIVEIADGLADILYIANGTAVAYGIPLDKIFEDIHKNNMTKLGPDGKPIIVNGKVQKPETYKSVDISNYFRKA